MQSQVGRIISKVYGSPFPPLDEKNSDILSHYGLGGPNPKSTKNDILSHNFDLVFHNYDVVHPVAGMGFHRGQQFGRG